MANFSSPKRKERSLPKKKKKEKEKNDQLVVIYLQKISFRNERKIKIFSDEVKVREFIASRCTLN